MEIVKITKGFNYAIKKSTIYVKPGEYYNPKTKKTVQLKSNIEYNKGKNIELFNKDSKYLLKLSNLHLTQNNIRYIFLYYYIPNNEFNLIWYKKDDKESFKDEIDNYMTKEQFIYKLYNDSEDPNDFVFICGFRSRKEKICKLTRHLSPRI